MFENLLPYIRLGINFLNDALEFLMQLIGLLTSAEESISGYQVSA